jgi:mono/diheme cytochrome c family protein
VKTWIEDGAPCEGVSYSVEDTGEVSDPGKQVYDAYCAGCHGPNGEGVSAPPMSSVVPGLTADEVANIARSGSGGMPPVVGDPGEAQLVGEWAVEQWGD